MTHLRDFWHYFSATKLSLRPFLTPYIKELIQQCIMIYKMLHGQISLGDMDISHPSSILEWPHYADIPAQVLQQPIFLWILTSKLLYSSLNLLHQDTHLTFQNFPQWPPEHMAYHQQTAFHDQPIGLTQMMVTTMNAPLPSHSNWKLLWGQCIPCGFLPIP